MTSRFTQEGIDKKLIDNPDLAARNTHKGNPITWAQNRAQAEQLLDTVADEVFKTQELNQVLKGNKYHAVRTESALCGRTFDSKAEARRGEELYLRQKAGEILDLEYQVKYRLCDKPSITVTLDFRYWEGNIEGHMVYEDVKGVLTRDSRTKYAWLKEKHGIEVRMVK